MLLLGKFDTFTYHYLNFVMSRKLERTRSFFKPVEQWNPITGQTGFALIPVGPIMRDKSERFQNQRCVGHYNAKVRKTFTRAIGYA